MSHHTSKFGNYYDTMQAFTIIIILFDCLTPLPDGLKDIKGGGHAGFIVINNRCMYN